MPKQSTPNTGPFSVMHILAFLLIVSLYFTTSGCDINFPGGKIDPPIPNQTVILDITLEPDTVALGDTVLIHCIIKDSLDSRFKYEWKLGAMNTLPVDGRFDGPRIKWVAKNYDIEPGSSITVRGSVKVDNGSKDSLAVSESVRIPIKNYSE